MRNYGSMIKRFGFVLFSGIMLMTVPVSASEAEPYYVKADDVEVYYEVGSEHVVSVVSKGDKFLLVEEGEEFSKILLDNGLSGYIATETLSEEETKATVEEGTSRGSLRGVGGELQSKRDTLIEFGKSKLGCAYSYGSRGPNKFDCSGFVGYTYEKALGIKLPRDSRSMSRVGVKVAKNDLQKGDLVFFNTGGGSRISHVGIYVENGTFIHASSGNVMKVITSTLDSGYYAKCYNTARRIFK